MSQAGDCHGIYNHASDDTVHHCLFHVLLSPFKDAAAAESLQMACAASGLAIADVKPFIDLTRPGAATRKGVLVVQTDGRLHRRYALKYHASAARLQREHACSGRIVSIAEKAACLFDNSMTLSSFPRQWSMPHRNQRSNSRLGSQVRGRGLHCRALGACRQHHVNVTVHVCLPPAMSV